MHSAKCTLDQNQYSANTFSEIPIGQQGTLKENLVCPACNRPAFYRRGTDGGRGPCFCARPHADDCTLKSQVFGGSATEANEQGPDLLSPDQTLVVDFSFGAHTAPIGERHGGFDNATDASASYRNHRRPQSPVRTMRLGPVLKQLLISDAFAKSMMPVHLPGLPGPIEACELFLPALAVSAMHEWTFHAFWGRIAWANFDDDYNIWLNFGGPLQLGIWIKLRNVSEFMARFSIQHPAQLKGAFALVLGRAIISQRGKPYVIVQELPLITLQQ